jgi:hypothetical protein
MHLEISWNSRISGNSMVEKMALVVGKSCVAVTVITDVYGNHII